MGNLKKILNSFNSFSLRSKLGILFSIVNLLICSFIYIYFPIKFKEQSLDNVYHKTITLVSISAADLSTAMLYYTDTLSINESIHRLKSYNHDVSGIVVLDTNRKTVSGYEVAYSKLIYETYNKYGSSVVMKNFESILVTRNIRFENKKLGTLCVIVSLKSMNEEVLTSKWHISWISLAILILGILLVLFFSNIITKPLNKLVKSFNTIADGDFSHRVLPHGSDELIKISNAFNLMVERLEIAYNNLQSEIAIRKEKEIELNEAKEVLAGSLENEKKLNALRANFISMISHEYRTPMTVILSSTYLLEAYFKVQSEKEFKKHIERIQSSVQLMTRLMEDVLEIGRSESGKFTPKIEPIQVIDTFNDLTKIVNISLKNNFEFSIDSDQSEVTIYSDKQHFYQLFSNILTNACKYSGEHKNIDINIKSAKETLYITVRDYGIGIPQKDLDMIFEPFFRANNVGTISGTGLGMTIIKNSVQFINGSISIQSTENQGTIVYVTLPIILSDDDR